MKPKDEILCINACMQIMGALNEQKRRKWKVVTLFELVRKGMEKACLLFLSILQFLRYCLGGQKVAEYDNIASEIHDKKDELKKEKIKAFLSEQNHREFRKIPAPYEIPGVNNSEMKGQYAVIGSSATTKSDAMFCSELHMIYPGGRLPQEIQYEIFQLLFEHYFERLLCLGKYNLHEDYYKANEFVWSAADSFLKANRFEWSAGNLNLKATSFVCSTANVHQRADSLWSGEGYCQKVNVKEYVVNSISFSEAENSKAEVKGDNEFCKDILLSKASDSAAADNLELSTSDAEGESFNSQGPTTEKENIQTDDNYNLPVETQASKNTSDEEDYSLLCYLTLVLRFIKATVSTRVMRLLFHIKKKWQNINRYSKRLRQKCLHHVLRSQKMFKRQPVSSGRYQQTNIRGNSSWTGLFVFFCVFSGVSVGSASAVTKQSTQSSDFRPIDVYVDVNKSVTFYCGGESSGRKVWKYNDIMFYHYKHGYKENVTSFNIMDNGNAIRSISVQLSDYGEYICISYPTNESHDATQTTHFLHDGTPKDLAVKNDSKVNSTGIPGLALNNSEVTSKDNQGFSRNAGIITAVVSIIVVSLVILVFSVYLRRKSRKLKLKLRNPPTGPSAQPSQPSAASANTGLVQNGCQQVDMNQLLRSEQTNDDSTILRRNDDISAEPLQGNGVLQV